MSKIPCVSTLISSTDEYCRYKSDVISHMLLRHLQELSSGRHMNIFDPGCKDVPKLYLCLHQLISTLDHNSDVLWAAVEVVRTCCSNTLSRNALVSNYKFIAPLTELLLTDLTHDKKMCVLHILLELTKEMEILQKETSLLTLTSKLTEFIIVEWTDVSRLSVRILVNICHNNAFLVHSLKSCISSRFFRAVMNLRNDSICAKLEMCKLLHVLEPISLAVDGPPDISKTILDITFSNLIEAYEKRETLLLLDIVEFFKELAHLPIYMDLLCSYDRCPEYSKNILRLLEGCDYENVFGIFGFIHTLLLTKVSALRPVYPQIMKNILPWLQTDVVCLHVLGMIKNILQDMENDDTTRSSIVHSLEQHLPNILQLYNSTEISDTATCLVALLQLLQEMIKFEELREELLRTINVQRIEEIFSESTVHLTDKNHCRNVMMLHVCALNFLSSLALYDLSYLQLRDKLWCSSEVQKTLAASFYEGEVRKQVLNLINTADLSDESISTLAKTLFTYSFPQTPSNGPNEESHSSNDLTKCLPVSLVEGCQVDALVEATKQKLDNNEIKSVPLSTVMSLLEYKVAAASRTEQNLNSNLEISRSHCAEGQQQLVEIDSRIQQMRELLLKDQQCAEYLHVELQELKRIVEIDKNCSIENQKKYQEELSAAEKLMYRRKLEYEDLRDKVKIMGELRKTLEVNLDSIGQQIATNTDAANEHAYHIRSLEQELQETECQYVDEMGKFKTLDVSLKASKAILSERETEATNLKKENACLEVEVANLQMLSNAQENIALEKDKEIKKLKKELSELKRIKDVIADIAGGKKKSNE